MPAASSITDEMVWVPAGTFQMGFERHYPEEAPAHPVTVDGFWIERHQTTNQQFAWFVYSVRRMRMLFRRRSSSPAPAAASDHAIPGGEADWRPPGRGDTTGDSCKQVRGRIP
jgi:formylglycine-generating enzyme